MHKRTEARIASMAICATGGAVNCWFFRESNGNMVPTTRKAVREAQRAARKPGRRKRKG